MAHVPLKEFYNKRLEDMEEQVSQDEMGVSSDSINGGYVSGSLRKVESFEDIKKRRKRVNTRLKRYAQ